MSLGTAVPSASPAQWHPTAMALPWEQAVRRGEFKPLCNAGVDRAQLALVCSSLPIVQAPLDRWCWLPLNSKPWGKVCFPGRW